MFEVKSQDVWPLESQNVMYVWLWQLTIDIPGGFKRRIVIMPVLRTLARWRPWHLSRNQTSHAKPMNESYI